MSRKNVSYLRFTQGGPEGIAYQNGMKTLDIFRKYGIPFEYSEMPGGHNWYVWRFDLEYFAQRIFKKVLAVFIRFLGRSCEGAKDLAWKNNAIFWLARINNL